MQTFWGWKYVGSAGVLCKKNTPASAISSLIMNNDAWGLFCLFAGLETGSSLFCEKADTRQIWGYNGWQMHWPAPGYRASEVFVCTSWFLRLNGYRVLAAALDQNSQSEQAGRAPQSTWQNKMGPRRDSEYNISANKRAVYWDDTSERPTLCCFSCKFKHNSVS